MTAVPAGFLYKRPQDMSLQHVEMCHCSVTCQVLTGVNACSGGQRMHTDVLWNLLVQLELELIKCKDLLKPFLDVLIIIVASQANLHRHPHHAVMSHCIQDCADKYGV